MTPTTVNQQLTVLSFGKSVALSVVLKHKMYLELCTFSQTPPFASFLEATIFLNLYQKQLTSH